MKLLTLLAAPLVACALAGAQANAAEIHDVIRRGEVARAESLVTAQPELVNARDERNCTPLHFAVNRGNLELTRILLDKGADIAARDTDGDSPLHWAAIYAGPDVVDLLISRGADVNAANTNGQTVLDYALRGRGGGAVIDRLLDAGVRVVMPPDGGGALLLDAASAGSGRLADSLMARGADRSYVNGRGETLLHRAARGGLDALVEDELNRGVAVDVRMFGGETPLAVAVSAGQRRAAEALIARGADVNAKDNFDGTLLHCAAESGDPELVAYFLDRGLEVDARNHWGGTPLVSVAQISGDKQAFDLLLASGANPTLRDNTGETAFTWAAIAGRIELARTCWGVLSQEQRREFGPQALDRAAAQGRNETVAFLLDQGVDVNSRLWNGRTPLSTAASGGMKETAELLLARGARTDIADELGRTALHEAAVVGRVDIIEALLARGAALNALDNDGNSPLFLARAYERRAAAESIAARGGEARPADPDLLEAELKTGEAAVWSLGHSSWAVKTSQHFLVFDYTGRDGRGADHPALSNGNIVPEQLVAEDVLVFTSHAHTDHYNPVIYGWKEKLPSVRYFFGWDVESPFEVLELTTPRSALELADVSVYTVYDHHETVPELALLIKVDGLDIFFSGDYLGHYEEDLPYLKGLTKGVDLAFCGCGGYIHAALANELGAKCYFPMHAWPFMYEGLAQFRGNVKSAAIMPPAFPGDRFIYRNGRVTQCFARRDRGE